jgi:outer membrane lipoprotein-sorting protein
MSAFLFMQRQKGIVAVCMAVIALSLGQLSRAADDARAQAIVDGVSRLFVGQSTIATVEMQVTKPDLQRKITMQLWSVDESNILIRIRSPREDAGTSILKVGSKILYYLPKANRTVKISASMMMSPWMGSDFTLNDLVKQSRLTNDYAIATTFDGQRDGAAISEYTLTPKPAAVVVWGKITLEVRHADHMPVRQRYYDEDGKLVRELTFSEYKTVSGRLIPTHLVMRPAGQVAEETTITYDKISFDQPIGAETFSKQNLKQ